MAKIVTITNPLTGQPAQVDQLDHTAQQIDDAIARALPGGAIDSVLSSKPNPNLLDNWYFGNPINQRGQTSYTGAGYGIDRWTTDIDAGGGITITDNGVLITSAGSYWGTRLDNIAGLSGKTVTGSILMSNGTLYSGTIESVKWQMDAPQMIFANTDMSFYISKVGDDKAQVEISTGRAGVEILAAKLELGSTQTLAHQDADGVWQLNEIPDYGEQLARCQRHCIEIVPAVSNDYGAIGSGSAVFTDRVYVCVPLPVTMRAQPTVSYTGNWKLVSGVVASDGFSVNGIAVDKISNNSVTLNVTTANQVLTVGTTYHLWRAPASKNSMLFSADL